MDLLQIALIFLILLLSIFLGITGIQVFFILRDLKKALDKFNLLLEDMEKPVSVASKLVTTAETQAVSGVAQVLRRIIKPKPKRFYKKIL